MPAASRSRVPTNAPNSEDAIPEPLPEIFQTKKTVELCGVEHARMRCTRTKGHDGPHESLALDGPQRW